MLFRSETTQGGAAQKLELREADLDRVYRSRRCLVSSHCDSRVNLLSASSNIPSYRRPMFVSPCHDTPVGWPAFPLCILSLLSTIPFVRARISAQQCSSVLSPPDWPSGADLAVKTRNDGVEKGKDRFLPPFVVRSFKLGNRSSRDCGNGVRSRMVQMISTGGVRWIGRLQDSHGESRFARASSS